MAHFRSRFGGFFLLGLAALILIALGIMAGTAYLWTSHTRSIADAFRPHVDSKVVLAGAIERLQAEGKLVILSADVRAESYSSTQKKILNGLLDLGETSVEVRAPARVQYVIQLDQVKRDDFLFDPQRRRLVLAVPNPKLDTTIVDVSSDPSQIDVERRIGLFRLDAFSGTYNENRARKGLRAAAIHAGQSGWWLPEAQASARNEISRLLAPLLDALEDDVTLVIAFHDGRPASSEYDVLPSPQSSLTKPDKEARGDP